MSWKCGDQVTKRFIFYALKDLSIILCIFYRLWEALTLVQFEKGNKEMYIRGQGKQ